jgi:hypothetical protein
VWLDPRTTRVIEDGPRPHPVLDWADLIDQRPGIPPSEPDGGWHPMWEAAASALSHLLAASGCDPILIPDHRVAGIFRPTLDRLVGLVSTGPVRTLVLAGPGLPTADGDFALVPEHPQTGEYWPVASRSSRSHWPGTAGGTSRSTATPSRSGGRSRSCRRPCRLEPDGRIFLSVLARLPEVSGATGRISR